MPTVTDKEQLVHIPVDGVTLEGALAVPAQATGLVLFVHGSGSSRFSPRNNFVARELRNAGLGTLLIDLLTRVEDQDYERRFDIPLLTQRVLRVTAWLRLQAQTQKLALGYFGASTGAAAALQAAADPANKVTAVVSRRERRCRDRTQPAGPCPAHRPEGTRDRSRRHPSVRGTGHARTGGEISRGLVSSSPQHRNIA
jgi:dienelactone hydrolase